MSDTLWHGNDDPPNDGAAVIVISRGIRTVCIYYKTNGGELWRYGEKLPILWRNVSQWRLAW